MGYNPINLKTGGMLHIAGGNLIQQQSMTPFIEKTNPYNSYNPLRGGSFIPSGGSFYPAGYRN